jgi:hypothetical protein
VLASRRECGKINVHARSHLFSSEIDDGSVVCLSEAFVPTL